MKITENKTTTVEFKITENFTIDDLDKMIKTAEWDIDYHKKELVGSIGKIICAKAGLQVLKEKKQKLIEEQKLVEEELKKIRV